MRALVQRVLEASVTVDGSVAGEIGPGLTVFLGIKRDDTTARAEQLARKVAQLRIFPDENGKMNRSLLDVSGELLVVSQFTLYGDTRKFIPLLCSMLRGSGFAGSDWGFSGAHAGTFSK